MGVPGWAAHLGSRRARPRSSGRRGGPKACEVAPLSDRRAAEWLEWLAVPRYNTAVARILHLTDLHVTHPGETLDTLWTGPKGHLNDQKFDFIVVSGDLSQRADPSEYTELLRFSETELLPLLSRPTERDRVIFVPGNHDASWSAPGAYEPMSLPATKHEEIQKHLKELREAPEEASSRINIGNHGHLELYRVDLASSEYRGRFANVQTFFDGFYQNSLQRQGCKPFGLHSNADDWSSHFFAGERVVFVGLSSCYRNDKYWHGASFNPKSIAAARDHLRNLRRDTADLLVVAVWHHGFSSSAGRPDRLMPSELGCLFNLGVSVGFHGHTHQEDLSQHTFLRGKLAVVATGSLGAGDADRPAAARNQFSIIDLFPSRLQIRRINRGHTSINTHVYDEGKVERIEIPRGPEVVEADSPWIQRHSRTWLINDDGTASVTVEMEGIQTTRPIALALVNPPYCTVKGNDFAKTATKPISVASTTLRDGRTRFTLTENCTSTNLQWRYLISNAFALTQEELALVPDRKPDFPNIDVATQDVRSHTVRYDCDELIIRVEIPPHLFGSWSVQVESPTPDGSDTPWELEPSEAGRCSLEQVTPEGSPGIEDRGATSSRAHAQLTVRAPTVGYRYSLVSTRPKSEGTSPLDNETKSLLRRLHDLTRQNHPDSATLPATLATNCARALAQSLGLDEGAAFGNWVAFLWNHASRCLVPAFGRFPPRSWSVEFPGGHGVAGHCFRHAQCVAWSRSSGIDQLIYQDRERGDNYESLVAVPIRAATKTAVGVISIARTTSDRTTVDQKIHDLAASTDASEFSRVTTAAHAAFWETLANSQDLADGLRKKARSIADLAFP